MSFQICPHFNIPQKIYVVSSVTSLAPVERTWLLGPLLICTILFCSSDMDNERYSCFPHTRYSFQVIDFEETNFDMHITCLLFAFFPLHNSLAPVDLMNNICDIPVLIPLPTGLLALSYFLDFFFPCFDASPDASRLIISSEQGIAYLDKVT